MKRLTSVLTVLLVGLSLCALPACGNNASNTKEDSAASADKKADKKEETKKDEKKDEGGGGW